MNYIILIFIFTQPLFAGDFLVRGLLNYNFHLAYEETSPGYVPDEYQSNQPIPGIGQFYNNGGGFSLEINYRLKMDGMDFWLLLNSGYDYHSILSTEEVIHVIFGQELSIQNFFLTIGFGKYISDDPDNIFFYGTGGLVLNFYNGTSTDNDLKTDFGYDQSTSFRFGFGMDIPISKSFPLFLNSSVHMDLGNIDRGKVNYYYQGKWVARAKPTGDQLINDDKVIFKIGLTYIIKLDD